MNTLTETFLARLPLSTLTVALTLPAFSLTEYALLLKPIVTPKKGRYNASIITKDGLSFKDHNIYLLVRCNLLLVSLMVTLAVCKHSVVAVSIVVRVTRNDLSFSTL